MLTEHPKATWTYRTEIIQCFLKDGITQKSVFVKYQVSDTGIIDLKVVEPLYGELRSNFDSLKTDIGEYFKMGHGDSPYKDYRGLFQKALQ